MTPDQIIAGLRQVQEALHRLGKLGSEPFMGNSVGNLIAQEALLKLPAIVAEVEDMALELEAGEQIAAGTTRGTPPAQEIEEERISAKWKEVKPSINAQKMRSQIAGEIDPSDALPEYVWDILDIGIETALKAAGCKIVRGT